MKNLMNESSCTFCEQFVNTELGAVAQFLRLFSILLLFKLSYIKTRIQKFTICSL